jgi:hemerythrin-like domain-containing protein
LNAWRFVVNEARQKGAAAEVRLLRAMLDYLHGFPEALHHPKEDAYLFPRLRARTRDFDTVIDVLLHHHVDGRALLAALERALDRYEAEGTQAVDGLLSAFEGFAQAQWEHMRVEEKVILPAARRHLTREDWIEIADAFGENNDPRFGSEHEFRDLLARILHLHVPSIVAGVKSK